MMGDIVPVSVHQTRGTSLPHTIVSKPLANPSTSEREDMEEQRTKPMGWWKRTYSFVGFTKGYNLPLYIIFAGAMFGFSLARLEYLNFGGTFAKQAAPGEWYWLKGGHYRVGIIIHLVTILPCGLLMIWQFVPAIRHKFILFHRINGYTVMVLATFSQIGVLMILRRSFGGTLVTQAGCGLLVILVFIGFGMAYYNIKRLQIDQHRAWMLRTMFWLGTIITLRIIMIISALIISKMRDYYGTFTCDELAFTVGSRMMHSQYPQCFSVNGTTNGNIAVEAAFTNSAGIGVSFHEGFPLGLWLAIFLHTVGVEIYLNLTRNESERLRQVSYEKQVKAGMRNPGSAGLTSDRWGDVAAWKPALEGV